MGEDVDAAANALLESLGGGGAKKSKKKKNNNKTKDVVEDEAEVEKVPEVSKDIVVSEADKIMSELGIEDADDAEESKKKKKKPKKKEEAEKTKPISSMGKLAALHLQKRKEEEEALKRAEEERLRAEEEKRRKEEEEARILEEKKQRWKEEKKREKEEARRKGIPITKAQKQRAARTEIMRQQLIREGKVKVDSEGHLISEAKSNNLEISEDQAADTSDNLTNLLPEKTVAEPGEPKERGSEQSEPFEVKPLVSNWEDLGVEDWETKFSDDKIHLAQSGAHQFNEEAEKVVEEDFVEVQKPKKVSEGKTGKATGSDAKMSASKEENVLRSPICVVMGHVDVGKTKILDQIRKTNVQDNEAGGITQQIGATFFPIENLRKITDRLNADLSFDYKVPGLLMIDTPGHESFSNLRKRGSTLCDIAILIVDLMHGLEQQTIESLNLLRTKKTPFIVALNKVDRLYSWQSTRDAPIRESLAKQKDSVILEFEDRTKQVITQLMEQGLNSKLYYENDDFRRVVSLVPTSAHTGEGIPDLLLLLIQLSQKMLFEKISLKPKLECSVIEVKKIEGIGTTVDVVLVNGELHEGDEIIVATLQGGVKTQIKALLTPQPLREMRIKSDYIHHKTIKAAMGIKIVAPGLEEAIAGTELLVYDPKRDRNMLKQMQAEVMEDFDTIIKSIDQAGNGVCVQSSTLGSLEALLDFLAQMKIPVNCVNLGPIHKKDVMRASVMLEHKKEFALILAFDVKVTKDAQELSEELGVKIFTADIIYHLFDQFTKYMEQINEEKRNLASELAVFPCVLQIIPENIFNKKSPLILGVEVLEGIVKTGTPIVIPDKLIPDPDNPNLQIMLSLGKVESIEKDHKEVPTAKKGSKVCVKIQGSQSESYVQFGRHFDEKSLLYSKLTRESIDALKLNFKDDLDKADWLTVIKLKKVFNIP